MGIILAMTLTALVLVALAMRVTDNPPRTESKLTVAAIQARLAAEPPRTYVPISRGW
ncbi:hypothetical protein ACFRAM_28705 [Paenibacillus sp. NPDC056722]|uniref:hypothetical protein n=1 Tax=Paenibacillus sp. NPDC056722 TaxID=3345924 RepID=UPI0036BC9341